MWDNLPYVSVKLNKLYFVHKNADQLLTFQGIDNLE